MQGDRQFFHGNLDGSFRRRDRIVNGEFFPVQIIGQTHPHPVGLCCNFFRYTSGKQHLPF